MKTVILTPTNRLENSIGFYSTLNFTVIPHEDRHYVSDGKALIEIDPRRAARAGIKIYKDSWAEEAARLEEFGLVTATDEGYLLSDPNGMRIYLVEGELPVQHETSEQSFSELGNYMGVSLETTDLPRSAKLLETLGFTLRMGSVEKRFAVFGGPDGFHISLLGPGCPHLFFNPSLTYFNGKNNPAIIEKIRSLEIPIAEEITYFNKEGIVDNIIIRDPGGYGFFIFND